eukprot:gene9975-6781_t
MFQMIFGARYLLLGMGFFATYVGFLYNDCFALMLEYSPSRYRWPANWDKMGWDPRTKGPSATTSIDPICVGESGRCAASMAGPDGPTPFGFDVAWMETGNKINVYNSFKEKNAVILGVTQMIVGIFLKLANHRHFAREDPRHYKHIFFGFLPECLFLGCTFGYMSAIIIYKWAHGSRANLLETMTNFFLSPGGGPDVVPGKQLYAGQAGVQVLLLLVAVVCVFLMLLPIPFIEWREKQR